MAERRVVITQGEMAIDRSPDVCISTLLGSCVACCLWDPVEQIGGVNHMLIADSGSEMDTFAGVNEMELLINGLVRQGADRRRLSAKVFGGAQMLGGNSTVGERNGQFTLDFLKRENIPCTGHSLGGTQARHLLYWPMTGVARQRIANEVPLEPERKPAPQPVGNDVDLF